MTSHEVRGNTEQSDYDEHTERARRMDVLQRAESEFDPTPFDTEAARISHVGPAGEAVLKACASMVGKPWTS